MSTGVDVNCVRGRVGALAVESPAHALEFLSSMLVHGEVREACHELAHVAGRASASVMTFDEAAELSLGRLCVDGFLHGSAEGLFAIRAAGGTRDVAAVAAEVCTSGGAASDELREICAHGAGHALYGAAGSLAGSLNSCREVAARVASTAAGRGLVRSCADGVFMAWAGDRTFVEADMNICREVHTDLQEPCYLYIGFVWMQVGGAALETMVVRCESEALAEVCAFGVGRATATVSDLDMGFAAQTCRYSQVDLVAGACVRGSAEYVETLAAAGQAPEVGDVCAPVAAGWAGDHCRRAVTSVREGRSALSG